MRLISRCLYIPSVLLLASCISACSEQKPEVADAPSPGELLVKKNCKVCHAQGINGAPIIGNNKMWDKRTGQGLAVLTEHAINGYGLMPAKGGKTDLTDDEIETAVKYMLSQLEP